MTAWFSCRAKLTFVEGDAGALDLDGGFEAAVGCLVLMHQQGSAKTLRSVAAKVRGGGIVAFQEYNVTSRSMVAFPPTPLWENALGRIAAALERAGVETEMGSSSAVRSSKRGCRNRRWS